MQEGSYSVTGTNITMLCFKMVCVILNLMRTAMKVENTTMIKT